MVKVTSIIALLAILLITQANIRAIKYPTNIPPTNTFIKLKVPPKRSAVAEPIIIATKILNRTIAVASLKRLSPSTRIASRLGAPRSLKIATTATGSVADNIAPKSKHAIKPIPETAYTAPPTKKLDINNPTTAKNKIGLISAISFLTSIAKLLSKIRAGRKTKIIISDVSSKLSKLWKRSLIAPICVSCISAVISPSKIPTIASSTV